ncbi:MAG TPA: nitrate/nitrite transporter [Anaeromyxobacteraceae bacterium]|nr:nitrate/nitrite transporter [Anaeromyxobacteraceae bacterium]
MERSETWKRNSVLAMNTFGFTVMFAVWVIFAIVGIAIRREIVLTETEFALLVALPVLTGSLLRLPMGMATDWYGGRPLFTALLASSAIPLLLLCVATRYWQYLVLGLFIGMAGTSFAVGIAYTSAWFPQRLQGTALGIFGAGNTGASLTKLLAPPLMAVVPAGRAGFLPGGWRFVPFVYAIAVVVTAVIYWSFTYTDHSHHKTDSLGEMLSPLRHMRVWRFSLYYFLVFGGYVALSLWLPKYYIDVFGLSLQEAALLTAVFVFPSGIIRAPGGWLSDRFGARTVMYWVLGVCVLASFLLMFPDLQLSFQVPARYATAGDTLRLRLRMNPYVFTALVFVLGIAMGIGKAAVFKHIPHYFPDQVGSVGGLVGVIGGLGGFIMPILFGAMAQSTHLPTTTFAFLFALSVFCLVWMHAVVRRLTRAAAPAAAEELDQGPAVARS